MGVDVKTMDKETLSYYNTNSNDFIENTLNVDFAEIQNKFMDKLQAGSYILDFGCGSGRDAKCFLKHGYTVDAIDGSEELCRFAGEYTGLDVKCMYFQDLDEIEKYDAIWACSSILHCSREELALVMNKMSTALKPAGLIYTSFKYGEYEGLRNGRYFTDMTKESLKKLLAEVPGLQVEELWVTSDVRPGRGEEKWLNLFLRKK